MSENRIPPLEYTHYTPASVSFQKEPVLFLHGFATRSDQLWAGTGWIRQYVRSGIPVVSVDLPFHGRAFLKDPNFTVDAKLPAGVTEENGIFPVNDDPGTACADSGMALLADALAALLDSLMISRVHVVGFSFGSRLGWELALHHPKRVTSLIVGGMPLHNHLETLRTMLTTMYMSSPSESMLENTADAPHNPGTQDFDPATAEVFTEIIGSSPLRPEALSRFVSIPFGEFFTLSALSDAPTSAGGSWSAASPNDFPAPQIPLLIAIGSEDSIAADGRRLYPLLRGSHPSVKFLDIPGRDHVSALTSGVFRRNALAFIQENSASASGLL